MVQRTLLRTALAGVALCLAANGAGAATLALQDKDIAVGIPTAVNLPLTLVNDPGDTVAAAQVDIVFDPDVMVLTGVTAGPAANAAAKDVAVAELEPGRVRVVVAGMNMNTMADGVLANVSFILGCGTPGGDYALPLEELMLCNAYGLPVPAVADGCLLAVTALPLPAAPWWIAGLAMLAVAGAAAACRSRIEEWVRA